MHYSDEFVDKLEKRVSIPKCDAHIWTDKEGNEHEYALFDQDLGA